MERVGALALGRLAAPVSAAGEVVHLGLRHRHGRAGVALRLGHRPLLLHRHDVGLAGLEPGAEGPGRLGRGLAPDGGREAAQRLGGRRPREDAQAQARAVGLRLATPARRDASGSGSSRPRRSARRSRGSRAATGPGSRWRRRARGRPRAGRWPSRTAGPPPGRARPPRSSRSRARGAPRRPSARRSRRSARRAGRRIAPRWPRRPRAPPPRARSRPRRPARRALARARRPRLDVRDHGVAVAASIAARGTPRAESVAKPILARLELSPLAW